MRIDQLLDRLLQCLFRDGISLGDALHQTLRSIWRLQAAFEPLCCIRLSPLRPIDRLHAEAVAEGVQEDHAKDRHDADVEPSSQEDEVLTRGAVVELPKELLCDRHLTQSALDRGPRQDRQEAECHILHHHGRLKRMAWKIQDKDTIDGRKDPQQTRGETACHNGEHVVPKRGEDVQRRSASYHAEEDELSEDPHTAHDALNLVQIHFRGHR
mmetsp:Transcript_20246/g.38099  ORF Transcript_20246/g.38099 Transcript_20246/m.38099 type:complete len:212 (-) Transcript_20246:241-876(-)